MDDLVNTHARPEKSLLSFWAQPAKGELKCCRYMEMAHLYSGVFSLQTIDKNWTR
jgi:hypothetical protein